MKTIKKWGAVLLWVCAMVAVLGVGAFAEEADAEPVWAEESQPGEVVLDWKSPSTTHVEEAYINPLYADVIQEWDLVSPQLPSDNPVDAAAAAAADSEEYLDSVEEAGAVVREGMKQRLESIVVHFQAPEYSKALLIEIADQALVHTGVPTEGDYLRWQYGGWNTSTSYYVSNNQAYMTITYTYTYYTTSDQEAAVDKKLAEVFAQLDVAEDSDYDKVRAVYDYICAHTVYDHDNLSDDEYTLKYTAYAALIDEKAVCQGYALLFYRMMLELGVDSRLISGTGNGGAHGWNIVQLDGLYYNADTTWDAGETEYDYFLKCDENFKNHVRDEEYAGDDFYAAYPMDEVDYLIPQPVASGSCGDELTWTLDEQGVLTIRGTGEMEDAPEGESLFAYSDLIQSAVLKNGVTRIGAYAFYGCTNLQSVRLPDTVTQIGDQAFGDCTALESFFLPEAVASLGTGVWSGCSSLTEITAAEENPNYLSLDGVLFTADQQTLTAYPGGRDGTYAIPSGTASVGAAAFCKNLYPSELTVSASVTEVGAQAFAFLEDRLASISFYGDAPAFGAGAFDGTTTTIFYPGGNETWEAAQDAVQSEGGTLTWQAVSTQPDAPVITSVYSQVQTSAKVTWTQVENADGYELYRAAAPDAAEEEWALVKTILSGDTVQYTNSGLEAGQTYYYKVRAYLAAPDGSRSYSEFSNVSYMPAAVLFDMVYSNATSRIRLVWNAVEGAHGYQLWRKDEDGSYSIVKTLGDRGNTLTDDQGDVTAYSNTGLTAGSIYTYKMRAFSIFDGQKIYGAFSDEFRVAVMPETTVLTVSSAKTDRVTLSWDPVDGASGYQIWRAESGSDVYSIAKTISSGDITSYINSDLTSGTTYQYKIRAFVEVDGRYTFGAYSEVQTVQTK